MEVIFSTYCSEIPLFLASKDHKYSHLLKINRQTTTNPKKPNNNNKKKPQLWPVAQLVRAYVIHQGCRFNPWSGHMFLSFSLPYSLSKINKYINTHTKSKARTLTLRTKSIHIMRKADSNLLWRWAGEAFWPCGCSSPALLLSLEVPVTSPFAQPPQIWWENPLRSHSVSHMTQSSGSDRVMALERPYLLLRPEASFHFRFRKTFVRSLWWMADPLQLESPCFIFFFSFSWTA